MKKLLIIIFTFAIALATSILLDWEFIAKNYFRTGLVILFILIEIAIGYFAFKYELKPKQNDN